MKQANKLIKLGVSGILLDSIQPQSILLIKREKDPFKNKWTLPGGSLERGETIQDGIQREILQEVGYHVTPFPIFSPYITERITNEYNIQKIECQEQIENEWFALPQDQYCSISQLKYERELLDLHRNDCTPNLQNIIQIMLQAYINK